MRRIAIALLATASTGCFTSYVCDGPCPVPCEGSCVSYVGGFWVPVLVTSTSATCPEVAHSEVVTSGQPPVTACRVQQADGECSSTDDLCLPDAAGWRACVARDGAHECPSSYAERIDAPAELTLCCPADA